MELAGIDVDIDRVAGARLEHPKVDVIGCVAMSAHASAEHCGIGDRDRVVGL
jgi:hypothetical protein